MFYVECIISFYFLVFTLFYFIFKLPFYISYNNKFYKYSCSKMPYLFMISNFLQKISLLLYVATGFLFPLNYLQWTLEAHCFRFLKLIGYKLLSSQKVETCWFSLWDNIYVTIRHCSHIMLAEEKKENEKSEKS